MLFVVIKGPSVDAAIEKMEQALPYAEGLEIRLDTFDKIDLGEVRTLIQRAQIPVMLTIRSRGHGGLYKGSEKEREALMMQLLVLEPPFLDVEYDMRPDFLEHVCAHYPKTKIICSLHNFDSTPADLDALLLTVQSCKAYAFKLATMAHSTCDALRMLCLVQKQKSLRLAGICMGEFGQPTRILGPVVGNFIDYASLEGEIAAPGQLTAHELCTTFRYKELKQTTTIYGLIGDPVSKSFSHLTHNRAFALAHLDAVYVKMALKKEELPTFFTLINALPFQGLSVTMPLKEEVQPHLHKIDFEAKEMGAVNTLVRTKEGWSGYNSDARGALDAIEAHARVKDKQLFILGRGGASKAIAFEAKKRGAKVTLLGSEERKASSLESYDILVNTTPSGMSPSCDEMPLNPQALQTGKVVMDIIMNPQKTRLLQEAEKKGCTLVFGSEMFINQALGQFDLWFGSSFDRVQIINTITSFFRFV